MRRQWLPTGHRASRRTRAGHQSGSVSATAKRLRESPTLSRWAEAERHFDAAIEMNAEMGALPWSGHTRHDYARMLLVRGEATDRERALELIAGVPGG